MRLIDADDLIDGYKHMGYDPTEHPEESYMEGWCKGFNAAVDHCMHHVIHAPTIVPQRIKCKWTRRESDLSWWYECSECGESPLFDPYENEVLTRFCPWCGAEMQDEQEREPNQPE